MFLYVLIIILLSIALFARLTCGVCKSATCLVGKTAIVTGGNAGIGYQVCLNLASRGCRVIIADKDDSTLSRQQIINETGNNNIISKKFDLGCFQSIRQFVDDIKATESRLDILINNAGVGTSPDCLTVDGLNPIMQINYFGPFLLTCLLVDLLEKSKPSRIVFTSSIMAFLKQLTYDDIREQKVKTNVVDKIVIYSITKLATTLIVEKLAEKLENRGVIVNAITPGWVRTDIFKKLQETTSIIQWFIGWFLRIGGIFYGKSAWEGSQTTVHVAVDKSVNNLTGKLFFDCTPFPNIRKNWTSESSLKIWRLTEELAQIRDNERI